MDTDMRRSLAACPLVSLIAGSVMLPSSAEAGRRGRYASPFVGGLADGALIGGSLAAPAYAHPRSYYSRYAYAYYPPPARCFRRVETRWNGIAGTGREFWSATERKRSPARCEHHART
jgi:hypothetical protein